MSAWFALMAAAAVAYASTNIDGYVLLLGFFSSERYRAGEIVMGQLASLAVQLAIAAAVTQAGWLKQGPFMGLAGVVPLMAGINGIAQLRVRAAGQRPEPPVPHAPSSHGARGRVAAVAIVATSGALDNVLVYASLLASRTSREVASIAVMFAFLTLLLCLGALWTAGSRSSVRALRSAAGCVAPFTTAAIGVSLLIRFDTLSWIYSLA